MPRTVQVNLSETQYADLMTLLSHGEDQLDRMIEDEPDEETLEEHRTLKTQGVPALIHVLTAAHRDQS